MATNFELRQIDAVMYDDGWVWNDSFYLSDFSAEGGKEKSAFLAEFESCGYVFDPETMEVVNEQDDLIIVDKKTEQPLYAAVWVDM